MAETSDAADEAKAFLKMPLGEAAKVLYPGSGQPSELPPEHFEALNHAVGWLASFADQSCECDLNPENPDGYRDPDNPDASCIACAARHAIERINKVIEPPLNTLHPGRAKSLPEAVYLERWRALNRRGPSHNYGRTALEAILNPDLDKPCPPVTPHDATVCTTLVQWLGTNCGRAFVEECERQIREGRQREFELSAAAREAHQPGAGMGELLEAARGIAANWIQDNRHYARAELTKQIVGLVMQWGGGQKKNPEPGYQSQRYFDLE